MTTQSPTGIQMVASLIDQCSGTASFRNRLLIKKWITWITSCQLDIKISFSCQNMFMHMVSMSWKNRHCRTIKQYLIQKVIIIINKTIIRLLISLALMVCPRASNMTRSTIIKIRIMPLNNLSQKYIIFKQVQLKCRIWKYCHTG